MSNGDEAQETSWKQSKNEMTATGRRASFQVKMKSEEDVQPAINRIAQYIGGAFRDGTVTGVNVAVREIDPESEESVQFSEQLGRFQAPVKTDRDISSVHERIAQYLAAVARDPNVELADVGVEEFIEER